MKNYVKALSVMIGLFILSAAPAYASGSKPDVKSEEVSPKEQELEKASDEKPASVHDRTLKTIDEEPLDEGVPTPEIVTPETTK